MHSDASITTCCVAINNCYDILWFQQKNQRGWNRIGLLLNYVIAIWLDPDFGEHCHTPLGGYRAPIIEGANHRMTVGLVYTHLRVQSTGIFVPVTFDAFKLLIPHLARPPPVIAAPCVLTVFLGVKADSSKKMGRLCCNTVGRSDEGARRQESRLRSTAPTNLVKSVGLSPSTKAELHFHL